MTDPFVSVTDPFVSKKTGTRFQMPDVMMIISHNGALGYAACYRRDAKTVPVVRNADCGLVVLLYYRCVELFRIRIHEFFPLMIVFLPL